jgi:hypothetical protein
VSFKIFLSTFGLLLLGILPPFLGNLLDGTSMALGLTIYLIAYLIYYLPFTLTVTKIPQHLFYLSIFIISHSIILYLLKQNLNSKSILSVILLILMFYGSKSFSSLILSQKLKIAISSLKTYYFLVGLCLIALITDFYFGKVFYGRDKTIYPFGEVSHFALFFGPFLLFYFFHISNFRKKLFFLLANSILAITIESFTLLIYIILTSLLLFKFKPKQLIIFLILAISFIIVISQNNYFLSRLDLSSQSNNLTALVYLQGLIDAYNSLNTTYGIGLGFQMLGTQEPSEIHYQIQSLLGQDRSGNGLNRFDGGFLAAKIISEFGFFGITLILFYLTILVRTYKSLKAIIYWNLKGVNKTYLFGMCIIYASSVEFFIRGVGYFSPSIFLLLVALQIVHHIKKNNLENYVN